jgi:glycosyltransferase involved in cell wall biosynthesis
VIEPNGDLGGARGHAWEQAILPIRARGRPIWAPCSTGPVAIRDQIVTIHDAAVLEHPEWFAPRFAAFYQRLLPMLAHRVARIVTVSEYSRDRLSEQLSVPADRIDVVWNGVGENFRPVAAPREIAGFPAALRDRPFFMTLFTQEPRKNIGLVLAAWRIARPHLPADALLAIVGGTGMTQVFGAADDLSGVGGTGAGIVHCGYVPDAVLPAMLSATWGLIYPSLYEGFGLPALEAMACGAPAVVTALTSLPEICGNAALYVDAHDPADLAGTMRALAADPVLRSEQARRGIERAAMFSWDRAGARMDAILSDHA